VLACTATATPIVRDEIVEKLGLPADTPQLVRGFARPNLVFRAVELRGRAESGRHVDAVLRECLGAPGAAAGTAIVYSPTRKRAEEEAARLIAAGWRCEVYHAGLSGETRHAAQHAFAAGELEVVVATNAFGMGIDRPDVRCVVHLAPPDSIEAYYQEAGRAGRDGREAVCLLLLSPGDMPLRRRLIERGADGAPPPPEVVAHKWNLFLELMRWAEGGACRHDAILRYFGDDAEVLAGCGRCDACLALAGGAQDRDEAAVVVRKALCGVARLQGRFGLTAAAKLLHGTEDERLQRAGLHRTPTFGTLAARPEEWLVRLLRRCVTAGWIDFAGGDRPVVVVTREGLDVIHERRPARLLLPPTERPHGSGSTERARKRGAPRARSARDVTDEAGAGSAAAASGGSARAGGGRRPSGRLDAPDASHAPDSLDSLDCLDAAGRALFDALRAYRLEQARREAVPPYLIASDRTLRAIASLRPRDLEALQLAPGIGPAKAARYGEDLLRVVRESAG